MSDVTSICPYCRSPFEPEEEITTCEACATPHHADCYAENGGCTVFGCANAPADEKSISISSEDLRQVQRMPTMPPPPPRPGSTTSVPPPPRVGGFMPGGFAYSAPSAPRELSFGGYTGVSPTIQSSYTVRHSRVTFILLGVFLGMFGAHNFYAGYTKRAVAQLLISLLSCFGLFWAAWIWAIVEVCVVKQDAEDVAFV